MAEEEETREVLFPDWEGPDKTGFTIEHTGDGEIFVKEVKVESPAARSGRIVGATIYFDNMSSEDTAELLKTLNRHKVGLKLQNRGDKSPGRSPLNTPLSTPCRSPMGTLTWEGKSRFGGSSPDIVLSGDDDDYKRIYTKKIKPRLKSEDLAEGVDVRTERHSSTSSDGSTITTITRRITTYTVDMPGGISEKSELSSPEVKGLRYVSGDGSPCSRISHGSLSGKDGAEEGVFELGNVSLTTPQVSSTETHWSTGGLKTTTTREMEADGGLGLRLKGPQFGMSGGKGQGDLDKSRGLGEHGEGSMHTGIKHVTTESLEGGEIVSADVKGASIDVSLPGKITHFSSTSVSRVEGGDVDIRFGKGKACVSDITIGQQRTMDSGRIGLSSQRSDRTSTGFNVKGDDDGNVGKHVSTEVDISLKGKNLSRKIDASEPNSLGERMVQRIDNGGTEAEMKMPKISIPSLGFSDAKMQGQSVNINHPIDNIDTKTIKTTIKRQDVDIGIPSISGTKISMPDISLKRPELTDMNVSLTRIDGDKKQLQVGLGQTANEKDISEDPEINISTQKANVDFKAAHVDIQGPAIHVEGLSGKIKATEQKVDVEMKGAEGGFKIPKVKMASFGIKAPELDGSEVDIDLPKANTDIKIAAVDIKGPAIDVGLDDKHKGLKSDRHSTSGTKLSMPNVDSNLIGPSVKGNLDISGPDGKIQGSTFMPSISGPKLTMPHVDFNVTGTTNKGGTDVSVPNVEGDIKAPKVEIEGPDVNIEGAGLKMPIIKVPFGSKVSKIEGPHGHIDLPKADIDIQAPNFDIKGPDIDIDGPDGKVKGSRFKLPFSGPNISMPNVDLNMTGPTNKGGVDVSVPKIEGDIKVPKVEIDGGDVNIDGAGFKMPKIRMPSFGSKYSKVEGPEVNIDLPKAGIDIKAPKVDIKGPEIDIDGPEGKIKGSKFKMPRVSGPTPTMPNLDLTLTGPTIKGGADSKVEGDIRLPKVEIEDPDIDIDGSGIGFKMPKMKVPKIGFKGTKLDGPDQDIDLSKADIDIKAPKVDIKEPEINVEGPDGKIKGSKFKLPSVSAPSISMPNVDFNLTGPTIKGGEDVSVPKIEGDIGLPKVEVEGTDVNLDGAGSGFQMPKIKIPSFGFKGPKVEGPEIDIELPKADIDMRAPNVDIKVTEIDVEGPDGEIKGPKFKMPSISGPKVSLPDIWMPLNLKGPSFKGDVDVSVPKIGGDIKTPKVEIEGPDVGIEGPEGGFKMPKMKMPSFGFKGPKVEGPNVDIDLPKADIDIQAPSVDIKVPEIGVEGPDGKIKGPKFKMPSITGPKIAMPDLDFNLKGPSFKSDVDVSVPKIGGDIKTPKVEIEGPDVGFEGPEGGFKMPTMKMPSFGFKGPKVEGPNVDIDLPKADIDIQAPIVDIKVPEIGVEGPDGKIKGPKFKMPSISGPNISMPDIDFNLKGPRFKGDVDVSVPKIGGDIKTPKVEIEGPDVGIEGPEGGFKMPKIKMPSFGFKGPKVEGPDVDIDLPKADIDIQAPHVDIKGPQIDIEGPDGKIKGPKFKMPSISGPKISMPDIDFNLKGPSFKGDVDVSVPKIGGDIKTPKVDLKCQR
ncbi:hypothetical protein CRUP_021309 [Coryphaenoides rupestris]|nr:hypothetical protein CRUP_021309 [Coryphaenoides rupestris]